MKPLFAAALGAALAVAMSAAAEAREVSVKVNRIDDKGLGEEVGKIYFKDGPQGLIVSPRMHKLPPGPHGFHIHETKSCDPKAGPDGKPVPGLSAGGHYDPDKTAKHLGPHGQGHKGDLPTLVVAPDGTTSGSVVAPRLKVDDLKGKSLIIHGGGDNYADQPSPLGGGGARIACATF